MKRNPFTLGLTALMLISLSTLTALAQNTDQTFNDDSGNKTDRSTMQQNGDDSQTTHYVVNRPVSDNGEAGVPCPCSTVSYGDEYGYENDRTDSCCYKKYRGCHYRHYRKPCFRLFRWGEYRRCGHYNYGYSNDYYGRCCRGW